VLEHWATEQPKFIKIFPHEYKRVLGVARARAVYASPTVLPSLEAAVAKQV
jgi:glutamate synthase domain-containing protein 3